jgi:hypothetical protein
LASRWKELLRPRLIVRAYKANLLSSLSESFHGNDE